jgi:hypothetical protein
MGTTEDRHTTTTVIIITIAIGATKGTRTNNKTFSVAMSVNNDNVAPL